MDWHKKNPRPLPWSDGPRDPYHIWISEVIMQQTRIEQGAPYYHRFIARFPDILALANATIDDVLQTWQGLGYYTRARNLHKAARFIVDHHHGHFPGRYEELLALPGIGPYSAAAIASFAYGLSYPVVDGNVKRLMARFNGIEKPIDGQVTHDLIRQLAANNMKGAAPAVFNQAIMNFGALVCKPKYPSCPHCPLHQKCQAYLSDQVDVLPVRAKNKTNRLRYFHFLVLLHRGKVLTERRELKDIWHGLYVMPYLESNSFRKPVQKNIREKIGLIAGQTAFQFMFSSEQKTQVLSHQTIVARFHYFHLTEKPKRIDGNLHWVTRSGMGHLAKPKIIVDWWKQNTSFAKSLK